MRHGWTFIETGIVIIIAAVIVAVAIAEHKSKAPTAEATPEAGPRFSFANQPGVWTDPANLWIVTDRITGRQYLCAESGDGLALTPLLEASPR